MAVDGARGDKGWRDIASELLRDIRAGRIKVGDRIPSITALAQQHRCARKTAQRAVEYLRNLGAVETIPSSGTRVIAVPVEDGVPLPMAGEILGRLDDHDAQLAELRARVERLERREDDR